MVQQEVSFKLKEGEKMLKAYCAFHDFNKEAQKIITSNNIDLTINQSDNKPTEEDLVKLIDAYDILIVGIASKFTADMIQFVKKPLLIATLSVGIDHIAEEFFYSPLVQVTNIKLANARSVAEHILALILDLNKRVSESCKLVLDGKGHKKYLQERPDDITGKTLGLIGAGNITKELVKIISSFQMKMKCYTKNPKKHKELEEYGIKFVSFEEVLKESDIINVSIPLTDETKRLISRKEIELLKPTATFINTSRTEIVDTEELIAYADRYESFYVGLDIDIENYQQLFQKRRNNVIVTPHTAGVSKQAIARMDLELANNIIQKFDKNN